MKIKDKNLFYVIGISFLCAFLSLIPYIIQNGGIFTLLADFNGQQIPFNYSAIRAVWSGSTGWQWNSDLGTSFVGAYGFYCIGSPFFYLACLFGEKLFPYLIGWFYMLKYAVAGATSYLYIARFTGERRYAVLGALLYAFSGFQSANLLFYHFHDVTALFPLLLLGMEKLVEDRKPGWFALAVALNCLVNYFFFIGEVLFAVLYFLFRFYNKPSVMLKLGSRCLIEGVLGVGMAAVLFLPSVLFVLANPRAGNRIYSLKYAGDVYLQLIKGLLLPAESMSNQSAVVHYNWKSNFAYLPLVGLSGVLGYGRRHKNWLRRLLSGSLVISFVPILTSAFYGFTEVYWRFWYMPILMMALATTLALEEQEDLRKPIGWNALAIIVLTAFLGLVPWDGEEGNAIYRSDVFFLLVAIALSGLGLLYLVLHWIGPKRLRCLTALIAAFGILTTSLCAHYYRMDEDTAAILHQYKVAQELPALDEQYRYLDYSNADQLLGGVSGLGAFNSTVSGGIFTFYYAFGSGRDNQSYKIEDVPGVEELLAGKYQLTNDPNAENVVYTFQVKEVDYFVTEQPAAPIGFARSAYMTQSEFSQLAMERRAMVSLNAVVVPDDTQTEGLSHYDSAQELTEDQLSAYIASAEEAAVENFTRNDGGFSCSRESLQPELLYFSVPADNGWTAYVDGEETEIILSNGMMAVYVDAGSHRIEFQYHTPGVAAGAAVSGASVVMLAAYLFYWKKRRGKAAGKQVVAEIP